MMTNQDEDMTLRNQLKITLDVPLVWLLSLALGVAAWAAHVWLLQEKRADTIARMAAQLVEQSKQINELTLQLSTKNLKDVEHDLKLVHHERRIGGLEAVAGK
jgi:uncharacterized integral membrane protein